MIVNDKKEWATVITKDFCYYENLEGKIIGAENVESISTLPDDAVAFAYVHQSGDNNFLRRYRIGTRIQKSIFDFYLQDAVIQAGEFLIVSTGVNCDYCMLPTPEKTYFYAISDNDVVVKDKPQLYDAFLKAIASKGEYTGEVNLKK